ncbi:cell division suppressor protein YneA [Bacillus sp. EB01]|uniref:cell division suppressor protein YneA n=1 Tax=Bacillus sp. EB01 TaxID=1347086 RepID=UPI0005C76C2E|nr:LysM peptidoglycan-binding domain-containing protein [Bacillus sp. EB01]
MKKIWSNYSYVIIILALSCIFAFSANILNKPADENKYITVTIEEGDSLWEIAGELSENHSMDRSEIVNWLKKNNQLAGETIFPGEELIVPVKKNRLETGTELASAGENE